jgi:hypothetical protein
MFRLFLNNQGYVFLYMFSLCFMSVLSREVTNTNFIVFGLTWLGFKPTIYCTRGKQANHYTTDVVSALNWIVIEFPWKNFNLMIQISVVWEKLIGFIGILIFGLKKLWINVHVNTLSYNSYFHLSTIYLYDHVLLSCIQM